MVSSTIRSVAYNAETMTLEIEFRRGGLYRYIDVPELVYRRLIASPSKGGFFNVSIAERFRAEHIGRGGP